MKSKIINKILKNSFFFGLAFFMSLSQLKAQDCSIGIANYPATVNLNTHVSSTVPAVTTVVWFTNNTHSGNAYATPNAPTTGTYYAFYCDAVNNCYSPASIAVNVTTTSCCDAVAPTLSF